MTRLNFEQYVIRNHLPTPHNKIAMADGVRFLPEHFSDAGVLIIRSVIDTAPTMFDGIVLVTGAVDGDHSEASLHWKGLAIDWRYRGHRMGGILIPGERPQTDEEMEQYMETQRGVALGWASRIARMSDFRVQAVVEKTHLHTEYDVKGAR